MGLNRRKEPSRGRRKVAEVNHQQNYTAIYGQAQMNARYGTDENGCAPNPQIAIRLRPTRALAVNLRLRSLPDSLLLVRRDTVRPRLGRPSSLEDAITRLSGELVVSKDPAEAHAIALALRQAISERIEYLRNKAQEMKRASAKRPNKK
jgi:hypothetical protein